MFDNILGQNSTQQLSNDIRQKSLAPSMLFEGPVSSGKASTALELSRVISCEQEAEWNCTCSSCSKHLTLIHPDLLCLGSRLFSAEITAAGDTIINDRKNTASNILFIRSVRKLLLRFNPVLWEDEPKFSKLSAQVLSLEEDLDEFNIIKDNKDKALKLINSIIKDANKLESIGISSAIPIEQIRRASYWCHLSPFGKSKFLLIENAESMKEGARNSLLKLLEEPPKSVNIVLTTSRPASLLKTMLSRLRPYRFILRSEKIEKEVLRRIFCNNFFIPDITLESSASLNRPGLINAYLDSFVPVSNNTLKTLAAFFAASAAYKAALIIKNNGKKLPQEIVLLGKLSAPMAEASGFLRSEDTKEVTAKIIEAACGFEVRSMFTLFCNLLLSMITESFNEFSSHSPSAALFMELWLTQINEAESSVMTYNQNISLALERLLIDLSSKMSELKCSN